MPLHARITLKSNPGHDCLALDLDEVALRAQILDPYFQGKVFMVSGEAVDPFDIEKLRVNRTQETSAQLLPRIRAERSFSRVHTMIDDLWYVTKHGVDVTGDWVTRPPGSDASDDMAPGDAVALIENLCRTFDQVARQLTRRHGRRHTLRVNDEYDVQDLLHALLRVHFADIRPEEWTPSYLAKSSRIDFLLPDPKIIVECKMTRKDLKDGRISDELAIDVTRYAHVAADTLICFIYDPQRLLKNPVGLEKDLASASTERLRVVAVVG